MIQEKRESTALILAAGKGTRMKSELPKVLFPLRGRPLIDYVLDATEHAGFSRALVVVGHEGEKVESVIEPRGAEVVWQREQLGTGHAVQMAIPNLEQVHGDVVVLMGDVPLIQPGTLKELLAGHRKNNAEVTVLTAALEDPSGYGRILRNQTDHVVAIVEHKDCSSKQLEIKEINSGIFAFKNSFLLKALPQLTNNNEQGEFYLTDTVAMAFHQGLRVDGVLAKDFREVAGINTQDQLTDAALVLESRA
jgi:bifunctional UDP-N-acetylglucosamine pyrophosphorylase/glucosamine-1-phosphate N-acetyltransferase